MAVSTFDVFKIGIASQLVTYGRAHAPCVVQIGDASP